LVSVVLPMGNANNIGESAFSGCTSLNEVSFNDSLTYIPSNAFSNTSIKKVTIIGTDYTGTNYMPAGIMYVGKNAFQDSRLSSLDFTKCSKLSYIDEYAFAQASITSLTLSEKLEKINSFAFNATIIFSLNIPDSVNYLGTNVFRGSALWSISLSPNIPEIPENTFRDCQLLSNITLRGSSSAPCRIKSIGDYAFKGCCSLENTDFLSGAASLESIGEYAFSECCINEDNRDKNIYGKLNYIGISDVTLPDNVTSIGKNAFAENYSLESVNLGAGVKVIPQDAFSVKTRDTSMLKKVILSDKLTRIEDNAFSNNGYLRTIGYTNGKNITSTDGSAVFADSLEYIGNSAFSNCSSKQVLNNIYNKNARIKAFEYTIAEADIHASKKNGDSKYLAYYKGNTDFSEVYISQSVLDCIEDNSYSLDEDTPAVTIY
ncbi:MAG: leucine-rich repeat domain-containing protein, partial [Lachnospiraceae bacterium]|nr:leucine-rich repeat domain-containing protein [Lachnospiraceae bacterium]